MSFGEIVAVCVRDSLQERMGARCPPTRSLLLISSAMSWKDMFSVSRPDSKDDIGTKQQLENENE